jgi:2,5-diamino-6-(ribosylamino)-4(3H)-pyrimidinone 5'-phosphate reductase
LRPDREADGMRVVVNAAVSADGKLSTRRREQLAISGPEDFARVGRLRADSDAVMVGVGTVLADDPHLTLDALELQAERSAAGDPPQPARVVADSRARTPADAVVLDDAAPTCVLVADAASAADVAALEDAGAEVVAAGDERVALPAALEALEARGVESLVVEGGGELLFSLFAADLVDELRLFVGGLIVGGREAPTLVDGEGFVDSFPALELTDVDRLDDGVVLTWRVD